jgi:hypothetical protein
MNKHSNTGATREAETDYPIGTPESSGLASLRQPW